LNYSKIILSMEFVIEQTLIKIFNLYKEVFGLDVIDYKYLPESGSNRVYLRLYDKEKTIIVSINEDVRENLAFLEINKQLKKSGVRVPEIYYYNVNDGIFLLQDLGDITLYSRCQENPDRQKEYYKKVIDDMPLIQIKSAENFNWDFCYPRKAFDKQSIMWDLQYFKSYFLRLSGITFDEQLLEDDFVVFANYLLETKQDYFLYRDFQSRNIMLYNDIPYYIDYQGGRKGALQYDLASLLFEAKANIDEDLRNELIDYYIQVFSKYSQFDKKDFQKYFYAYVLIRLLQALGAYGFRGYFQGKSYFIKSIAPALKLLEWYISKIKLEVKIYNLLKYLDAIINSNFAQNFLKYSDDNKNLTLHIYSFSYKKGIPFDFTGNGGGFVFDCRFLPNPGKFDEYKKYTGKDKKVVEFLNNSGISQKFIERVEKIIGDAIIEYKKNDYRDLMICFGCTGGQHRSVYCAEQLAIKIKEKFNVNIDIIHRELNKKN